MVTWRRRCDEIPERVIVPHEDALRHAPVQESTLRSPEPAAPERWPPGFPQAPGSRAPKMESAEGAALGAGSARRLPEDS